MNTQALYAGSFDPFTIGHWSVVDRALRIFDRVIIAIGENADKNAFWPLEKRLDHIRSVYKDNARVGVISYSGLTADTARHTGCTHLLRGVRSSVDFEYERTLADANRNISGLETVLLYTLPEYAFVSSSLVRDLMRHGHSAEQFLTHIH